MGCKGSKEGNDDKQIKSDFEHIGFPTSDIFFRTARDLLENAEKIRSGLEENREKGAELSGTFKLKAPKYNDVVQVLFWTLSAEADGQIKNTGVTVAGEVPYIVLESGKVSHDTFTLYETFTSYVRTVAQGPATLKEIIEKLEDLSKQTPDLTKDTKAEIQASTLAFGDKAKAIANLGKNTTKLPKELAKCKALSELIQQAATDIQELAPKLNEYFQGADETGAKAHADGLKNAVQIFDKFHTGERGTSDKEKAKKEQKEQQDKEKAAKKEQQDKEKAAKKEQKEKDAAAKKEQKEKEKAEKKDKKEKKDDKKEEKKEEKAEEKAAEEKVEEKAAEKHEEKVEEVAVA